MKKLKKAITLSYDDGVISDIKLIEIFNKYNMRCTFNLNSGAIGGSYVWTTKEGFDVKRLGRDNLREIYAGHEIACHGTTHANPAELMPEQLTDEFDKDILSLEKEFDQKINGMAYAYGKYDAKTTEHLKKIGIKYGRTVMPSHSFDIPSELITFNPTCHHNDKQLMELTDNFLNSDPDKPQLFYVWGHSYEFDSLNNWEVIEEFCKRVSNKEDIFYGTNTEVFRYFGVI